MKLRFLGQSYFKPHNNLLPTRTLDSTELSLRQNPTLARPIKSFKIDFSLRKYRGVSYVELRFLGQY